LRLFQARKRKILTAVRVGRNPESGVRVGYGADIVASWGAALRTGTAGSQDESRCRAIHKQRPYRIVDAS